MSIEPSSQPEIENLLVEARTFAPDPAFTAQANAGPDLYAEAEADFEAFWAKRARERLRWTEPFHTTLEWDLPFAKWFLGGRLNVSENCLDRHVENGLGDKVAYHWIGEPGDTRTLTYADLLREVGKAANGIQIPAPVLPSGMPVSGSLGGGPSPRLDLDDDPPGSGDKPGEDAPG